MDTLEPTAADGARRSGRHGSRGTWTARHPATTPADRRATLQWMAQSNSTGPDGAIKQRIEVFPQVHFATLFGSRARERHREDSDVDLGIYLDDSLSRRHRFDIKIELGNALIDLGRPDIVLLNDAPPLLGHRALLGPVLLIRDRVSYVRYFVKTLAAAGDEAPWRRLHRQRRARRLQEGTFGRP